MYWGSPAAACKASCLRKRGSMGAAIVLAAWMLKVTAIRVMSRGEEMMGLMSGMMWGLFPFFSRGR